MKNGFKETVDKILRSYGLRTRDCVGTVWSEGDLSWQALAAMGYRVERGINNPDYDYVIISKSKSSVSCILEALTKVKLGCIIIFRGDVIPESSMMYLAKATGSTLSYEPYKYKDADRYLGVLFKGKEI